MSEHRDFFIVNRFPPIIPHFHPIYCSYYPSIFVSWKRRNIILLDVDLNRDEYVEI